MIVIDMLFYCLQCAACPACTNITLDSDTAVLIVMSFNCGMLARYLKITQWDGIIMPLRFSGSVE